MSAVLDAAVTRRSSPPIRSRTAAGPLAREEGRRLVSHPIFLAGLVLSAALFTLTTWNHAPVLQRDDLWIGMALLPLAGATLLAANLATTRSRRHDTEELFESEATSRSIRTRGHLLSVGWAAGVACVFALAALAFLVANRSVGRPSAFELLSGPAVVLVSGALGVALGRWWPAVFAGPLALVAVAGAQVLLLTRRPVGSVQAPARWLSLWVTPSNSGSDPAPELLLRPAGWHLLYLLVLAAVLCAVALARWPPRAGAAAIGAASLALLVLTGSIVSRPPSASARARLIDLVDHPERYQVCQTHAGVRYCAFRGYAGWIDRWAASITPVLGAVPPSARPKNLVVRQDLGLLFGSDLPERTIPESVALDPFTELPLEPLRSPGIYPGVTWGRGSAGGRYELGMALLAATWAVGLPRTPYDIT